MEEPKYINYGNQQVDQNQFLTSAANDIEPYLNRQPWSNKRKELFRKAYSDIMSQGITGASNTSGFWEINHGGQKIDLDSKSQIEREMYGEAAYYIQQKMSGLATDKQNTEEEKKKDLKTLDNQTFISGLENYIGTQRFGGQNWNIGGPEDQWNKLDPRNEKGIRGRKNRADALAKYLEEYGATINETTHSFENSPFTDYQDFKTRLDAAVLALRNNPDTSDDALNALGINPSRYFNNGSGDAFSKGDYTGTYGGYQEYLAQQRDALAKQRAAEIASRPTIYTNTIKNNGFLYSQIDLADQYGSTEGLLNQVRQYLTKGLNNLTNNEKAEVRSAMVYGAKNPISNEEWEQLKNSPSLKGASRTRFKKINGIDNLFLDSATGNVIHLYDQNFRDSVGNDFLAGQDSKSQQEQYLQNTEFTNADWAELGGIVGDIVSILDPEPFSAIAAGVAAAGARNYARTRGPESWGFLDYLSQGADYLTGAIGGITGIGDALLAGKVAKNVVPWLRRAMRVPAFLDLWNSTPELIPIGQKLFSGQDLTVQDWMNLGTFFRGLATTRNLNIQNRASRKAMQERGYQVSNRIDKRIGLTSSKPITESGSPTVRMTINGKQEEIPISAETKAKLDEQLSKAGNNIESRSKIVRENAEVQAAAEKAGIKVKEKTTDADGKVTEKISDNWNNSKVVYNESLLNARLLGNKLGLTPSWARTSGGTFGESSSSVGRNFDNFENYLNSDRGIWDRIKYGSNRTLRGMDKFNTFQYRTAPATNIHGIWYTGEIDEKVLKELDNAFNPNDKKLRRASNPKNSSIDGKLIDGSNYQVKFGKDSSGKDEMLLIINGNSQKVKGNSLNEMKQNLGKMIREQNVKLQQNNKIVLNTNDPKWQDFVKSIKELKRKGYLFSHGGRIDRQKIQQYKEFMKR